VLLSVSAVQSAPGCTDINECDWGTTPANTHTCNRTTSSGQLCYNSAGSYSCGVCGYGSGTERHFGDSGVVTR
jgi:hypothetical protein